MLSEKIKTLRAEKGLSQEELSIKLNVVRQTVSKWEQGLSSPDAEQLVRLAEVFETSVGVLVGESTEEKQEEAAESQAPAEVKSKPERSGKAWSIVLICLGSPIWISLAAAAFAVAISVYATLWACIGSFWGCFAAIAASVVPMVIYSGMFLTTSVPLALVFLAAAFTLAGLSIFAFFGCKWATIGAVKLTKLIAFWLKRLFTKKEASK